MDYSEIIDLARKLGIQGMTEKELIEYEPKSGGLSGGVSWAYALADRLISCHKAGVAHDWLYERGGSELDRVKADRLFCYTATLSGKFIPDWLESWNCQAGKTKPRRWLIAARNTMVWPAPFARMTWRIVRAWGSCTWRFGCSADRIEASDVL
jgi:hypothetical protein